MADTRKFAQIQATSLAGSGAILGAITIILTEFNDIDGSPLAMTDFGTKGFATINPGSSSLEEQISFTGLTQNGNGTCTLSGISNVDFLYPYTETSGLAKTHTGGSIFIISNTSGFYNNFTNKGNDETITGLWDFPNNGNTPTLGSVYAAPTSDTQVASKKYVDVTATSGAPDANTTTKGIVQLPTQAQTDARTAIGSTGASLTPTPANLRTVLTHDLVASGVGTDAYAITITPVISAYAQGQVFRFKADVANTGGCTLNVSGVGAIALKVYGADPRSNYITVNSIVECVYNSTGPRMDIISVSSQPQVSQDGAEIYAASGAGTDTYAITLVPAIAAYTVGQVFRFKADVGNTGAATLNVNGVGAMNILRPNGNSLVTGDILANQLVEVEVYDATNCKMLSPFANTPSGLFSNGTTTKNAADASTTQTIAHGLGVAPKNVNIEGWIVNDSGATRALFAKTTYNGTTQSSLSMYETTGPAFTVGTTFTLNAANASDTQSGVVTVDATNISIAWTKTGSPSGTYTLLWEAQA